MEIAGMEYKWQSFVYPVAHLFFQTYFMLAA